MRRNTACTTANTAMRQHRELCLELPILVAFIVVHSALAFWAVLIAQSFQKQHDVEFAFSIALIVFLLLKSFLLTFTIFKSMAGHKFDNSGARELSRLKKTTLLYICLTSVVLAMSITLITRLVVWQRKFHVARDQANFIYCLWCLIVVGLDAVLQFSVVVALLLFVLHETSRFLRFVSALTPLV